MYWRKNVVSYLAWLFYTMLVGIALVSLGSRLCAEAGMGVWGGFWAALCYLAVVGGVVFLLHRTSDGRVAFAERNPRLLLALEVVLWMMFLVAGTAVRVIRMGEAVEDSPYFQWAGLTDGQQLPQLVHGAADFYIKVLHTAFFWLGNRYEVGIWLQIAFGLAASVILYFLLRRFLGVVSALVTFGFCMMAPYLVEYVLTFSPGMLYFLVFTVMAALVVWMADRKLPFPVLFFLGIPIAICCYLDISGVLFFLFVMGILLSKRKERTAGRKLAALGLCLAGTVFSFAALLGLDSLLSGKDFLQVASACFSQYQAKGFRLSVGEGGSTGEQLCLFGLMAFGIFGFWRDRRRDSLSLYVLGTVAVMLGRYFGIFTEEMPGAVCLYLLFSVLAGDSVGLCLKGKALMMAQGEQEADMGAEKPHKKSGRGRGGKTGKEMSAESILREEGKLWEVGFAEKKGEKAFFETEEKPASPERMTSQGTEEEKPTNSRPEGEKKVRYLDNPLPLPKKHVKRVLDYSIQVNTDDDFDLSVEENDDFDL